MQKKNRIVQCSKCLTDDIRVCFVKLCRQFISHFIGQLRNIISINIQQFPFWHHDGFQDSLCRECTHAHTRVYRIGKMVMIAQSLLICISGQISLLMLPSLSLSLHIVIISLPRSRWYAAFPFLHFSCLFSAARSHLLASRHRSSIFSHHRCPSVCLVLNYLVPGSFAFTAPPLPPLNPYRFCLSLTSELWIIFSPHLES